MDAVVVFVVCWVIGSLVIGEVGPFLLEVAVLLVRFLFIVLGQALKGGWWLTIRLGRGAAAGCLFLYILADEWRRGPREEEAPVEEEPPEEDWAEDEEELSQERERTPPRDPYEDAIALLGLAPGFSRTALNRAWKDKIRQAHPDAGGSVEQAQAINAARDPIAKRNGWK